MKPRDNVFQGGGAATTDPRKPDYSNLFALKGVDWDDPTVEQLAGARGQHPVEVMIDLSLANENQVYVQPLVNESPDDVLGILKHDRTLATLLPKPHTVGLGYGPGFVDDFEPEPHDMPLDAILNDKGVVWPVGRR